MSPFVARSLLVGASVVLLAAGVLAPLPLTSRTVVLVAACCCAVLDVLVVRSSGRGAGAVDVEGRWSVPADAAPADPGSVCPSRTDAGAAGADADTERPWGSRTDVGAAHADASWSTRADMGTTDAESVWARRADVGPATGDDRRRGAVPVGTVVAGHDADGRTVGAEVLDRRTHIVVVGIGALAHAVARALAVQVYGVAVRQDLVLRSAAGPDLDDLLSGFDLDLGGAVVGRGRCPPLPGGTAVVAADPRGPAPLTVVLVRGLGQSPRRWDLLVEVSRYGCTARRAGEPRGVPITPALPTVETPPVPVPVPMPQPMPQSLSSEETLPLATVRRHPLATAPRS